MNVINLIAIFKANCYQIKVEVFFLLLDLREIHSSLQRSPHNMFFFLNRINVN